MEIGMAQVCYKKYVLRVILFQAAVELELLMDKQGEAYCCNHRGFNPINQAFRLKTFSQGFDFASAGSYSALPNDHLQL